jgi:hypothetical protein
MNLTHSQILLIVFCAMCVNSVRYIYYGYIKAPRMIKRWKEAANEAAVLQWEKYKKQCRGRSIPLSLGAALLFLLAYWMNVASIYLHNVLSNHP